METCFAKDLEEWHTWFLSNHDQSTGIWLVYYKTNVGMPCISYKESVEEALCFGWVDSLIKKLDDERYARKFTPRKSGSRWSESNVARAKRMIAQGRMTEKGLQLFEESRQLTGPTSAERMLQMEDWRKQLIELLEPGDKVLFGVLPVSLQRQYAGWVMSGAKEETRQKRTKELVESLRRGERLGSK